MMAGSSQNLAQPLGDVEGHPAHRQRLPDRGERLLGHEDADHHARTLNGVTTASAAFPSQLNSAIGPGAGASMAQGAVTLW
jgi:hypothetical protein